MFNNRKDAGVELSKILNDVHVDVVIALPRGGVIVAREVANKLKVPLDFRIARKVGHPDNPEFAICVVDPDCCSECSEDAYSVPLDIRNELISKEQLVSKQREEKYRVSKRVDVKDKRVLLVDDGIATGMTIKFEAHKLKKEGAKSITVAVPVAPKYVISELEKEGIAVKACKREMDFIGAVSLYYNEFNQVTDEEVIASLRN